MRRRDFSWAGSKAQTPQPPPAGLDAVIDISHNVTVTDFAAVRRSNILAVIHKFEKRMKMMNEANPDIVADQPTPA